MHADEDRPRAQTLRQLATELNVDVEILEALTVDVFALSEEQLRNATGLHQELRTELASQSAAEVASPGKSLRRQLSAFKKRLPIVRNVSSKNVKRAIKNPGQVWAKVTAKAQSPEPNASELGDENLERLPLIELRTRLQRAPSQSVLTAALKQLRADGQITESFDLMERHSELLENASSDLIALASLIHGDYRTLHGMTTIPPRSRGAAYVPEPGRVLYCVHESPAFGNTDFSMSSHDFAQTKISQGVDIQVVSRLGFPWKCEVPERKPKAVRSETLVDGVPYAHLPGDVVETTPLDHYLQIAADAYVREARRVRPVLLRAVHDPLIALPALIAARRVGVPFVYEDHQPQEASTEKSEMARLLARLADLVSSEADAITSVTDSANLETHAQAERIHQEFVASQPSLGLSKLRVGLIADEFTSSTVAASCEIVTIERNRWREQLVTEKLDVMFVESAWTGKDRQWYQGVSYHQDEAMHSDIVGLLALCKELGIPSVFWNKEDPVHFRRFLETSAHCDHVFTTDANMLQGYLERGTPRVKTAASIPFYAQPAIHNPLPGSLEYEPTAAFAGTYYGDRFKARSAELHRLLDAARPTGLTIYDRQAAIPESTYHFPPEFDDVIRGALPYEVVIDSYKSHLAQLNVNSVMNSPTMFSRRVVEVAASGGVLLSAAGRGITETYGHAIPATINDALWRALLSDWRNNPVERNREIWLQMRSVYRSHTVDMALAIMFRTAGIAVEVKPLPSYGVVIKHPSLELLDGINSQSVRPNEVFVEDPVEVGRSLDRSIAVRPITEVREATSEYLGQMDQVPRRTHFEDMLFAARFGTWDEFDVRVVDGRDGNGPIASEYGAARQNAALRKRDHFVGGTEPLSKVKGIELAFAPQTDSTYV